MANPMGNIPDLLSLYDPSITTDQTALERQMNMAKLLRAQGMTPLDQNRQIGGMGYSISPWESIAKIAQTYAGGMLGNQADQAQAALSTKQAQALAKALRDSEEPPVSAPPVSTGLPANVTPQAMTAGGFPQPSTPPVAPAAPVAPTSKGLGYANLLRGNLISQFGGPEAAKVYYENFKTPDEVRTAMAFGQDPKEVGSLKMAKMRADALMKVAPNENVIDPITGRERYTAPNVVPQGFTKDASGALHVDPNWLSAEERLRNAGAGRVQTNVNAFTPASEAAQTEFMKGVRDRYDKLQSAPVLLSNIERSKQIVSEKNPFIGSLGDKKMAVAQFFNNNLGTNIAPEKIRDASELGTRLFTQVMDNLKKMDAQPSTYQQKVMEDAFGKITTDPKALPAILDVFGQQTRQRVAIHNKEIEGAVKRGVKFPYDPTISLEDAAGKPSGGFRLLGPE